MEHEEEKCVPPSTTRHPPVRSRRKPPNTTAAVVILPGSALTHKRRDIYRQSSTGASGGPLARWWWCRRDDTRIAGTIIRVARRRDRGPGDSRRTGPYAHNESTMKANTHCTGRHRITARTTQENYSGCPVSLCVVCSVCVFASIVDSLSYNRLAQLNALTSYPCRLVRTSSTRSSLASLIDSAV